MQINPASSTAQFHALEPATGSITPSNTKKNQSPIPQDQVTLSNASKTQQSASPIDVEHDNDNR